MIFDVNDTYVKLMHAQNLPCDSNTARVFRQDFSVQYIHTLYIIYIYMSSTAHLHACVNSDNYCWYSTNNT